MSPGRRGTPPPAPDPLRTPTTDAHTHLDAIDQDVATIVAEARAVGITRMVTTAGSVASSRWCAETAAAHPEIDAAVAVHPNECAGAGEPDFAEIARLAALPHVRAVGETGLDHYWDDAPWDVQEASFRRHLAIAKETGKPVVIHDRDAHDDVLRVLEEEGAPDVTVFHCFSGDAAMAKVCADRGYVMSFAGTVTFKNAPELREAAALAPPELILVETDAPYLTPTPYRGRPNAPYLVPWTVRCLAAVRGVPEDEIAALTAANAERVFGPPQA